jgi:hypothetical protein
MLVNADPRLAAALKYEGAAQTLLNDLHQGVLACRDPVTLTALLGKYTATAVARQSWMPGFSKHSGPNTGAEAQAKPFVMMSSILKDIHDTSSAIVNNLKG